MTGQLPQSDFIFRVSAGDAFSEKPPAPNAAWPNYRHPIIVAAAGGGSQAAAWTTKVMSELAAQIPNTPGERDGFSDNLALISGVSGGSVGALFVGAALSGKLDDDLRNQPSDRFSYDAVCDRTVPRRPHTPLALASLLTRQSGIDDVAWALVNPDVWHVLQPFFRDQIMDRGWALERSIEERTHLQETYLSDWAALAKNQNTIPGIHLQCHVCRIRMARGFGQHRVSILAEPARPHAESTKHREALRWQCEAARLDRRPTFGNVPLRVAGRSA